MSERYVEAAGEFANGDRAKSVGKMQELADEGLAEAQHFVGWCWEQGIERAKDDRLAFGWFDLAAKQGFGPSMSALGALYETGRGTQKDLLLSYIWHVRGAMEGEAESQQAISRIRPKLTVEQLRSASELLQSET